MYNIRGHAMQASRGSDAYGSVRQSPHTRDNTNTGHWAVLSTTWPAFSKLVKHLYICIWTKYRRVSADDLSWCWAGVVRMTGLQGAKVWCRWRVLAGLPSLTIKTSHQPRTQNNHKTWPRLDREKLCLALFYIKRNGCLYLWFFKNILRGAILYDTLK